MDREGLLDFYLFNPERVKEENGVEVLQEVLYHAVYKLDDMESYTDHLEEENQNLLDELHDEEMKAKELSNELNALTCF